MWVEEKKQDKNKKTIFFSSSELVLPEELPSVEEALKDLTAAMNVLKTLASQKEAYQTILRVDKEYFVPSRVGTL